MSWPTSSSLDPTARSCKPVGDRPRQATRRDPLSSVARGPWATPLGLAPLALAAILFAMAVVALGPCALADDLNDYPTSARADYVFGCMKANGETREILEKCSCSIDVIASIIPYDRYVTAETILSMSQVTGPVGSEFRQTETAKLALQEFRRAQAEAEVRCF
jgi:hypothetical protein